MKKIILTIIMVLTMTASFANPLTLEARQSLNKIVAAEATIADTVAEMALLVEIATNMAALASKLEDPKLRKLADKVIKAGDNWQNRRVGREKSYSELKELSQKILDANDDSNFPYLNAKITKYNSSVKKYNAACKVLDDASYKCIKCFNDYRMKRGL